MEITGTAEWAAWEARRLPGTRLVGPGVWSIPIPIPDNPLRYTLVYALELPDGVAVVDAGWDSEEGWRVLCAGLRTAGFEMTDVRAVLVTHVHPDHYGLAARVRAASGAWIGVHPADAALLCDGLDELAVSAQVDASRAQLRRAGLPETEIAAVTAESIEIRMAAQPPAPDVLIEDGVRLRLPGWALQAVWTPGHSPGHLCFHDPDRRLLLAGDHVLPRIRPTVTMHWQGPFDILGAHLDALRAMQRLDVDEVLPAHEYGFRDLGPRVDELVAYHEARLREIADVVVARPGCTCWEITQEITWPRPVAALPGMYQRSAVSATLAHLAALRTRGLAISVGAMPERWLSEH